jgi:hypothetical protein
MIGRADRLEQLVAALLNQDRPVVVPGALGMGKTTLALAAAYNARVIKRFGKSRRFFVNLEPAPDADGLLRRLAADLGLAASGAAAEIEAKIAAPCAAAPALAILDNLETPWRKDTKATEALLGRGWRRSRACGSSARCVASRPTFPAPAPRLCRTSSGSARSTRAPCSCAAPVISSPPTPPCLGCSARSTAIRCRSSCSPPTPRASRT